MTKTVFISGAARGIGRAIACTLAREGFDLYLTCLTNEELLLQLKSELTSKYSISCSCFIGDMSDYTFVESCFDQLARANRRLDVVINNAGMSYVGLLQDMKIEEWHRILSTNLYSAFYTSRLAIPNMLKHGSGHIINISSVWGNAGASMEVAYSAAKGGLNSFTKSLAKELAPSSIRVNAIAPGMIDTDMNNCFSTEEKSAITEEIPLGRMGTAEEVSELVLQLIKSPAYLTGQIISIDGGWL